MNKPDTRISNSTSDRSTSDKSISDNTSNKSSSRTNSDTSDVSEPRQTVKQSDNTSQHIHMESICSYITPTAIQSESEDIGLDKNFKVIMEVDHDAVYAELCKYADEFNSARKKKPSNKKLKNAYKKILRNNIKYDVCGINDAAYKNLIIEMTSLFLDNCIENCTSGKKTFMVKINKNYGKPENDTAEKKILVSNETLLDQMKFVLLRVNQWYSYMLSHKDIKKHDYFTYAAMLINERVFNSSKLKPILSGIMKTFEAHESIYPELNPEEIDLFEKRADGMTHLDYALALLMKYRWEIATYYDEDRAGKKDFILSEYEENILRKLYIDRRLVGRVLKSIREITKDYEQYVDYSSLISDSLVIDERVPEIKDPLSFNYKYKTIDTHLVKDLEKYAGLPSPAIRDYIIRRVDLYKNLVFNLMKPKENKSNDERLMRLSQSSSIKKRFTRAVAGILVSGAGFFIASSIHYRYGRNAIPENSESSTEPTSSNN
ncbi:hypothetical protein NEIRO03_1735 [Nematocida sp. AWRm78]|nr:hypothetical protein NEIRO02_1788 [Nematocida sp. AWRm79]KAI5184458.1 hypothetical protein NEIRO03_1735 [Nematocida sp. AWRm78]